MDGSDGLWMVTSGSDGLWMFLMVTNGSGSLHMVLVPLVVYWMVYGWSWWFMNSFEGSDGLRMVLEEGVDD